MGSTNEPGVCPSCGHDRQAEAVTRSLIDVLLRRPGRATCVEAVPVGGMVDGDCLCRDPFHAT